MQRALCTFRGEGHPVQKGHPCHPGAAKVAPDSLKSKSDEKKLDIYEDFPILYKKYYFLYYGKKVMTYTMTKKTPFRFPTERYLNVVKRGYKDCKLDKKYLSKALIS
mgnify:CR=1 FL=1